MNTSCHGRCGARERGAAAVEFWFVFPFLFLLVYGVIVYSYVYVLQESLTYAAQEAAEAAVAVNIRTTGEAAFDTVVRDRVRNTAQAVLDWLPDEQKLRVLGSGGQKVQVATGTLADGTNTATVTLVYDLAPSDGESLFPQLSLPFVGKVPVLPEQLVARAVARI